MPENLSLMPAELQMNHKIPNVFILFIWYKNYIYFHCGFKELTRLPVNQLSSFYKVDIVIFRKWKIFICFLKLSILHK